MWSSGDTVLWRMISFGHVRHAVATIAVEHTAERLVVWLPHGTPMRRFIGPALHEVGDLETHDWSLEDGVWRNDCLRITRFGDAHSIWLFWDERGFARWYVNLQEPLRPSRFGFDTRDQALDICVEPDGTWSWKDEDHLAAATARGRFTEADARAVSAEGERVLAAWPFPTGWEDWRPDPAWTPRPLPEGWHVV